MRMAAVSVSTVPIFPMLRIKCPLGYWDSAPHESMRMTILGGGGGVTDHKLEHSVQLGAGEECHRNTGDSTKHLLDGAPPTSPTHLWFLSSWACRVLMRTLGILMS